MAHAIGRTAGWKGTLRLALLAGLCLPLTGCTEDRMTLNLVGYNHTDRSIHRYGVNEYGGGHLQAHRGGGGFTCCISIPRAYKPGMTVTVWGSDWDGKNAIRRVVEVPRYGPDEGGRFAVHFLRSGEVKVFVTMMGLGHPDYPLKGEDAEL
ncbi:Protein of unknown function [Cupriavidus sp. OV096]|jgi:hypothetical protein|uniref:DUF3304 domain-containing protein n=1 Tax=Cupriavidus sp. OV096 TaxID=1855314 RepID=UPI0008E9ECB3|nr:DUF3304 domain-containing protein [Cupriavidus sp. OV096]SFO76515.1 Protein of unknown function [Cupriavidus sp. OV096]